MENRRANDSFILKALEEIKVEMAKVVTKVEERNDTALVWRNDVCKKFDKIFQWLEVLPCKERKINTKLLWGAIGITFGLVIAHLGWR